MLQWLKEQKKRALRFFCYSGDHQWLREVMDHETLKFVSSLNYREFDALEISGSTWRDKFKYKSFQSVDFPQYDICAGPLDHEKWDIIFMQQVLEHVKYPARAVRNVYQMLKPGGWFVVTTPFLLRIHEHPIDCSRWSAIGLKYFLEEAGFGLDKIQADSWGNRECLIANLESWIQYRPIRFQSLKNDPRYPMSVWAFAQK